MLYYISSADLPGKKAHTIQQVRMCQSFKNSGVDVCLLHPSYGDLNKQVRWEEISSYYGLNTEFDIRTLPSLHSQLDVVPLAGGLSMAIPMTAWLSSQTMLGKIDHSDIIYGRNYYGMFFFNEMRKLLPVDRRPELGFEIHTPLSEHLNSRFLESMDYVVSITQKLKRHTVERYDVDPDDILVAPDGVNLEAYNGITQKQARESLGIPNDEQIVMYTGHLYRGKGVETLVEAAKRLNVNVYCVGGYENDINRVKQKAGHPDNVTFTGFVDPAEIPVYQTAADILIAPYTEDSRPWVSPLKLFEYMAAGRPIVASNRGVLQEILTDGKNAILFEKGSTDALCGVIRDLLADDIFSKQLGRQAREDVEQYTWDRRAKRILSFISSS